MNIPQGLLFTKEHEWVSLQGNKAKIGISDYAQSSLGDVTFVELPAKGAACKQFAQCAAVESVKAASDIYAPLSGKVIEVNGDLAAKPELLNQSPYELGWLAVIEACDLSEKDNLLTADAYRDYVEGLGK